MSALDYERLADLLQGVAVSVDVAERHGELCGRLCVPAPDVGQAWLADVLEAASGGDALARAEAALRELVRQTAAALEAADMSFALLLPHDSEPLEDRAQALAGWCRGFLRGLGLGGLPESRAAEGNTGEILRDFAEISKAAFTREETAEEGEAAYAELVEFVRVSVQLVFEELRATDEAAPAADTRLH